MTRDCVVENALVELGNSDPSAYWADVLPGVAVGPTIDWCGAFALWALHQAGFLQEVRWVIGKGFLWDSAGNKWRLPITTIPEPGDVAYFEHNQHQAVVESVNGDVMNLINGNGTGGAVTRSSVPIAHATSIHSIAGLLPPATV